MMMISDRCWLRVVALQGCGDGALRIVLSAVRPVSSLIDIAVLLGQHAEVGRRWLVPDR